MLLMELKRILQILKNDKEVVLEAVKQYGFTLAYASEQLQNNKECLELLEKEDITYMLMQDDERSWYKERMGILANIREKELLEKIVIPSRISTKKIKF